MKHVSIDFSREGLPVFGAAQKPFIWWAVLACAAVLLLATLGVTWRAGLKTSELKAQIAELDDSARTQEAVSRQGSGLSADGLEVANAAVRYLNYPWADVLGALERHVRPEVTLISLEVGITRPSSKMVIQAPDVNEALTFVDSIKNEPAMRGITITKQEEVVLETGRATRMSLEVPQSVIPAKRPPKGEGR